MPIYEKIKEKFTVDNFIILFGLGVLSVYIYFMFKDNDKDNDKDKDNDNKSYNIKQNNFGALAASEQLNALDFNMSTPPFIGSSMTCIPRSATGTINTSYETNRKAFNNLDPDTSTDFTGLKLKYTDFIKKVSNTPICENIVPPPNTVYNPTTKNFVCKTDMYLDVNNNCNIVPVS